MLPGKGAVSKGLTELKFIEAYRPKLINFENFLSKMKANQKSRQLRSPRKAQAVVLFTPSKPTSAAGSIKMTSFGKNQSKIPVRKLPPVVENNKLSSQVSPKDQKRRPTSNVNGPRSTKITLLTDSVKVIKIPRTFKQVKSSPSHSGNRPVEVIFRNKRFGRRTSSCNLVRPLAMKTEHHT